MFQNKLVMPPDLDQSARYKYYVKYDLEKLKEFISNINLYTNPITKFETVYLESKTISQDKLREAGFSITRSKDKADFIVITNPLLINDRNVWIWNDGSLTIRHHNNKVTPILEDLVNEESKGYKYIFSSDLYKYIYKYDGNHELYSQIVELLGTNSPDNTRMAMEFMTNANWEGNELYLHEIFNVYWNRINDNDYKNSISFKGFIKNLDFSPHTIRLYLPVHYKELCKNDEHHDFVYNLFKEEFENKLKGLFEDYKIKLDVLNYSIDKSLFEKEKEC